MPAQCDPNTPRTGTPHPPRRRHGPGFDLLVAAGLITSGMVAGALLGRTGGTAQARQVEAHRVEARQATVSPYQKLAVFARVLSYVETEYVDEVDRDLVIEESIRGLLRRLDPHSQFFSASQVKQLRTVLTGQYSGVGLNLVRRGGQVVILSVDGGSPAARAGIRPGDFLLTVDGTSVLPLDLATITLRLRGQRGTRVVVETRPDGGKTSTKHALVRDTVRSADVLVAALPGSLGYVAVRRFSHGVYRQVRRALASLRKAHGGKLSALVLDLRDNPGGLMDEGIRLADLFLSHGLIVSKVGKRGRLREREMAHRKDTESTLGLVALINRGTASAAEIVAASLADHQRARLVGERSFGKGSMQSIIPLPDGSQLKLTIARYFRPSGQAIEGLGVTPTHPVPTADRHPAPPPGQALAGPDETLTVPQEVPAWISGDPALVRAMALARHATVR